MELVNLTHNDTAMSIASKCNMNFKRMSYSLSQLISKQNRMIKQLTEAGLISLADEIDAIDVQGEVTQQISDANIPGQVHDEVTNQISSADIPSMVSSEVTSQLTQADIPGMIGSAIDDALPREVTTTLSDFLTEDECTVTACLAARWGDMAFIRFSYRLNSSVTVPSNGNLPDITLGNLKIGWRPAGMTNVILDQTNVVIGDVARVPSRQGRRTPVAPATP